MVEPVFDIGSLRFTSARPARFTLPSAGSGQDVHIHHCAACGTKLALSFARWPDRIGVFAGTFDNPGWFPMTPDNTKHILLPRRCVARSFRPASGFSSATPRKPTAPRWNLRSIPNRASSADGHSRTGVCISAMTSAISGPRGRPVTALRSGMNSALPLRPVACLTLSVQTLQLPSS